MAGLLRWIAVSMVALVATGCGGGKTESDVEPPGQQESAKTQALDAGSAMLQDKPPIDALNAYLDGFHFYNGDIAAQMEDFIELHRLSRPEKNVFMDEGMRNFFVDVAGIMAERDWLQLSFLEIDGRKAAALFSFSYDESYQVYNSGYDPDLYGQFSPGIVLIANRIQWAIDRGYRAFDFLRGEEEYKYRMGARPIDVHELIIRNA